MSNSFNVRVVITDIMKNKYESKMQEAPTENDKQVYYKFFKTTE